MKSPGIVRAPNFRKRGSEGLRVPRRLALLGGTTSWSDCAVALCYLATPLSSVEGPAVAEYEQAFARQIGVRYATSFSAGRVGLYALLRLLGIGSGDEVLVQVPTHIVVANAVRYTGARPVYVDCRPADYNMDLELAKRRIGPRTRAIVLQHTFGIPADLDAALSLAERHRLALIEDCVHSLGATYDGRQTGSFGQAAFFSTEETKTISSTMGGMVVTDDQQLAMGLRTFQEQCAPPPLLLTARYLLKLAVYNLLTQPYLHPYPRAIYDLLGRRNPLPQATSREELRGELPLGYERRLSNGQAAIAMRQLKRLEENLARRRMVAQGYAAHLAPLGFRLPQPPDRAQPAFVRYPVWVEDREAAVRATRRHVVLGSWFTSVLEEAVSPESGGYEMGSCPRAEEAARHLVNLPTHPRVTPQDVEAITGALAGLAGQTER